MNDIRQLSKDIQGYDSKESIEAKKAALNAIEDFKLAHLSSTAQDMFIDAQSDLHDALIVAYFLNLKLKNSKL